MESKAKIMGHPILIPFPLGLLAYEGAEGETRMSDAHGSEPDMTGRSVVQGSARVPAATCETLVKCAVETRLPTPFGEFRLRAYENEIDHLTHLALLMGDPEGKDDVLVRVHSACLTGDALHSLRCDCGEQLEAAMERLAEEGEGVIVYMHQEGRGIGLLNKMRAYHLQDEGLDTVEANQRLGLAPDLRDYGIGAQILKELGLRRVRLLTNNLTKVVGLRGFGLEIAERVPIEVEPNGHNERYLKTKREKLNHVFERYQG
jgi:3,4-dihydroxy 2-butanone 4-phosphate synthase / GTP cyclohydrolase II